MKRILIFDKGDLGQWYGQAAPDGSPLRARRLEQAGRLEFVQIVNDQPPHWFVLIRNFDQSEHGTDRQALKGLTTPWGNGVWRFLDFEKAKAKFKQLAALPIFVRERKKAEELREKRKQHALTAFLPFPKKSNPPTA
jgi:hypothetical protein